MIAVLVGLSSALVYGAADFFGGLAAKRIPAILVAALSALVGLTLSAALAFVIPGSLTADAVFWGAVSGLAGSVAIFLLYAALAIGPMSILSPLTALLSAIVPMTWGLVGGERLGVLGYAALGLALVAVVLVGVVPERGAVRPRPAGLAYAVGAGVLIGLFIVAFDRAPDGSGLVPLVANRVVGTVLLLSVVGVLALRGRMRAHAGRRVQTGDAGVEAPGKSTDPAAVGIRSGALRGVLPIVIACGAADITANALILLGLQLGELSVIAVLTALYPAGTIALAAVVLRERIAPVQWIGLVVALAAAAMLALV